MISQDFKKFNMDAIIGLAVSTAFLRTDFDNQTSAQEVDDQNASTDIADKALDYLKWVGVDVTNIIIDKYTIAQCIWGESEPERLDEILSKS